MDSNELSKRIIYKAGQLISGSLGSVRVQSAVVRGALEKSNIAVLKFSVQ